MRPSEDERVELVTIVASGLFDERWYLATYPDVACEPIDPLFHFLRFGWREGRDPGPLFSVYHYLTQAPDVAQAGINPLAHYLDVGWREGRQPRAGFDGTIYAARHGLPSTVCPLVHEAARRAAAVESA